MPDRPPESPAPPEGLPPRDEMLELLKRAERGDESVLPAVRRMLDAGARFMRGGNIAGEARDALLAPITGGNLIVREQMTRQIDALAAELAGPDPAPVERLLAERAAFCWHVVYHYERIYAQGDGLSIKQADFHQRRIDAAHRRYLLALKALATVRKLALPAIQVNIARRQVNVAGPSPLPRVEGSATAAP